MFFKINKVRKGSYVLKRGVTIVEVLVAIIIFTLLIGIIVYALFSISKLERHVRSLRNIEISAVSAMERVTREVKSATSISVADSVFGSNPGVLTLISPISGGGSKTLQFFVSEGVLHLSENGVDLGQITLESQRSNITNLIFSLISINNIQGVRIQMTLESGSGEYSKTKNFYNTAMVRSTY